MQEHTRGVARRLLATGVTVAVATAGVVAGSMTAAHAAPVAVTGTLTDAAGNALDGFVDAEVLGADGFYDHAATAYVADGVVSLNLEPGTYKFQFGDDDRLFIPEYYNDKLTFETADPVAVAGAMTLAPVALAPKPTITGIVRDAAGQPVTDATVTAYDAATDNYENDTNVRADGTFSLGVDAGSYKIYTQGGGLVSEYYNNKSTLATADVVGAGAGLDPIVLSEGSVISGTVANPGNSPLERVRVTAYSAGGSTFSDLTDATGVYRIEGLRPGTYKVHFTDPVDEYGSEWYNDKTTQDTAEEVTVGLDAVVDVSAVLWPDPSSVIDPAKVDVSGTVVDSSGAPVMGAQVQAYDTPADGDSQRSFESATVNRAGQFFFTDLDLTSETSFKFEANDYLEREEGQYTRLGRWYGGAQSYKAATEVAKPASGLAITLPLTGGLAGTVTSESGLKVRGVQVALVNVKDGGNGGGTSTEGDGTYATTSIVPGTYKVRFSGGGTYFDGVYRSHAPEWYDNTVFSQAKEITIASGKTTTGINAALNESLRAMRKPEILGNPYLKGKVRATTGTWSVETGTSYNYEWLLGETVIGTERTLAVPSSAKNKRITLRVTASNDGLDGTALVSTQVIKKKPKVKISVTGKKAKITVSGKKIKPKKIKGKIVVKKIVRTDEFGAPVYKVMGKGKLANGTATVTLKKLSKGKNKVVFFITLKGGKLGDATIAKKIKFKG